MALVFADLVEETTATTGTGSYTLAGAATGFQSFSAGIGTSNETFYAVTDGTDWEVSRGTLSDGTTLTRATVLDSSNIGSAVNWTAGTRRIYAVAPAEILSRTPAAGRLVWLEDVGGNPGLPAVDGSQLTGISAGISIHAGWIYDQTVPSITASKNVSSITDFGTGEYVVNFTTAHSNANYLVSALGLSDNRVVFINNATTDKTASALKVRTRDTSATALDTQSTGFTIDGELS